MPPEPRPSLPRGHSIFPLGIGARLGLSFLAVIVLAATANFIARQSVAIIQWRTQWQTPAPTTAVVHVSPAPPPVAAAAPLRADTRITDGLADAADRFERACQTRAQAGSGSNDDYFAAKDALRRAIADYGLGMPPTTQTSSIAQRGASFLDRGQQLVHVADQRRVTRAELTKVSQSMNDHLQTAINGAWKVFGRVIARQSLLELHADLDTIRRHTDSLIAGDELDADELAALQASENAFAAALGNSPEWTAKLKTDFDAMVKMRGTLAQLNAQFIEDTRRFSQAHGSFFSAVNAAAAPAPAPVRTRTTKSAPAMAPAAVTTGIPGADSVEVPDESIITHVDHRARNLMAMVTAVVLLLVITLSALTVISIVRPVKHIIEAAAQLADGKSRGPVPRGGIRELDLLAAAFNGMASRLTLAQDASRAVHEHLEEKVLERTHKLQKLAAEDPLTSLPNRRNLSSLLNVAIERAARETRLLGVYFLDIDNFKNFNDSLGHVFGDRVLMSVANRLEEIADGAGFVARLGGDEFALVYEDAASEQAIIEMGLRLVSAFQQLVAVDDRELSVSVSVGASIYPNHQHDAEGLLRTADAALFRAKELGRSRLALFTPELTESAAARFAIEQGLRHALERGEFELVYQPEVNLDTLEVGLVEALLRWRMPDGRIARPGEFLTVAEQSGLISEISSWVLRTAVAAAARWHHGDWPEARVAVNISSRQLLDPRFIEDLLALLQEFALPARSIELELTENILQTSPATIATLHVLHDHGFAIALDDFGTGFSSLTSLEQLPLTRIKLDRSLIASIDSSPRSAAIARAIIDLCAGLNLEVTAEGIERPAQLAWLLGCRSMYLQGYLLAEGVPFGEVLSCCQTLVAKMHHLLLSLPVVSQVRLVDTQALDAAHG